MFRTVHLVLDLTCVSHYQVILDFTLYSCFTPLDFFLCVLVSEASCLRFLISFYYGKSNSLSLLETIDAGVPLREECTVI
jgi:hypothetical protein